MTSLPAHKKLICLMVVTVGHLHRSHNCIRSGMYFLQYEEVRHQRSGATLAHTMKSSFHIPCRLNLPSKMGLRCPHGEKRSGVRHSLILTTPWSSGGEGWEHQCMQALRQTAGV